MQTRLLPNPTPNADAINTAMVLLMVVLLPAAGALADRTSRDATMMLGGALSAAAALPCFWLMNSGTAAAMIIGQLPLAVGLSLYGAVLPSWIVKNFPPALRYSAIGIGYNAAQALLGGTAPLISTALFDATGSGTSAGMIAFRAGHALTSHPRPRWPPLHLDAVTLVRALCRRISLYGGSGVRRVDTARPPPLRPAAFARWRS